MKKFIKYTLGTYVDDSRNKREIEVVKRFKCNIIIFGFSDKDCIIDENGYTIIQRKISYSANSFIRKFQILYSLLVKEPWILRKQKAYCISCHDIVALFIGWLSTVLLPRMRKPFLVYDSHEFELGRNTGRKRSFFTKLFICILEKFLMKRCSFSIMVNDTIADEVQRIHKLKNRPIVVRNIPALWNIDDDTCCSIKKELCNRLGRQTDTFLIMYHGGVMPDRGIERLIEAVGNIENCALIILGKASEDYLSFLKQKAVEQGTSDRILFHEAVPIDILWQYVGAADVGMLTIPAVTKSYYYMLPNKFFENIQSLTPIIGSDFPEIQKVVNQYNIGLLVDPENMIEIIKAIEEMIHNKVLYQSFKNNLKNAKVTLCWENESKVLEKEYSRILR